MTYHTTYHVYYGEKCVYPSLSKEEFKKVWEFANHLADLTELDEKLLSYEECKVNKELRTAEASY